MVSGQRAARRQGRQHILGAWVVLQELMSVGEPEMRTALLKKAFISDWDGAAPAAASEAK